MKIRVLRSPTALPERLRVGRSRRLHHAGLAALLALGGVGAASCEQDRASVPSSAPALATSDVLAAAWLDSLPAPVRRALELGSRDGVRLAAALGSGSAAEPEGAKVRVTLPSQAAGPTQLVHVSTGLSVAFTLEGAGDAEPAIVGDLAVYPGGGPSGADVLVRVHAHGVEDYLHFPRRPAAEQVRYGLELQGVAGLRLVASVLELLDEAGVPRLRVSAPWVVDATGRKASAALEIEGCAVDRSPRPAIGRAFVAPGGARCALAVRWSGDELAYPLLVDPSWQQTGVMVTARSSHTATVLPVLPSATTADEVLLVGGFDTDGLALKAAEIFHRPSRTFVATADCATARGLHTATLVGEGESARVLVVGGRSAVSGAVLKSAELYDRATTAFGPAGLVLDPGTNELVPITMTEPRHGHTATLLPSNHVLLAGGSVSPLETRVAEIYDLDSKTFTPLVATKMTIPRRNHTATDLGAGRVLLAGGYGEAFVEGKAEIFDAATETFTATVHEMTSVRQFATATKLDAAGGVKVLIARGNNGEGVSYPTSEIYDDVAGTFTQVPNVIDGNGDTVEKPLAHHAAVALSSGKVLIVGGVGAGFALAQSETYDPAKSPPLGQFSSGVDMLSARSHHTLTRMPTGLVLVAGGAGPGGALDGAEVLIQQAGEACDADGECESGFCSAQKVCCDEPCSGLCRSCLAAEKGEGVDGTCGVVLQGETAGGGCDLPTDIAYTFVCDGKGGVTAGQIVDCKPFTCKGDTCGSTCSVTSDCVSSAYCEAFACKYKKPLGETCGGPIECASGLCVDGVCCNSACDGSCQACDASGFCALVTGEPVAPRAPCAGAPPCTGFCDGNQVACVFPVVSCGPSSCADQVEVGESCNQGSCEASSRDCEEFACDEAGQSCRQSCTTDAHCDKGYVCTGDNKCAVVEAVTCSGHVLKRPTGEDEDCAPYTCENAACRQTCRNIADCVEDLVCDPSGQCTAAPPPPTLPASCAVSVPSPWAPAGGLGLAFAALGLGAALRRRAPRTGVRS